MTRLVAVLCWWDEDPSWLSDTIRSLPLAGVDHLVAVDGGYSLIPGATALSSREEHEAIRTAARDSGIRLTLYLPGRPWRGNELEKRTMSFRLSEAYRPDWLLVIDADERIIRCPPDLKDRLAETDKDYADVMSLEQPAPVVYSGMDDDSWPQIAYERHVKPRRCLIRAVRGITVGPAHYNYRTPDGRDLWGDEYGKPLRVRDLLIDHRNLQRPVERRQVALDYYQVRDESGAERHRKPLPSWA